MQIAIDGPAGAGKSTIAKLFAKEYGYVYIDTGAMYRAMALYINTMNIDFRDEAEVSRHCNEPNIELSYEADTMYVFLNHTNVTDRIRAQEVGETASIISTYREVRKQLVELQRRLAETKDVVMDGRDIGTNVLPKADLKIYLTASSRIRAMRRAKELQAQGDDVDIEEIKAEIEKRDYRDKTRELNPLCKAEDAVEIDSSSMTIEEVVAAIKTEFDKKCPGK